ncbi:MAG: Glu-tRNA(Gln) amidotransferase subunit GatE [Candidatus Micrarchaeota archaeon]
MKCGIEIHQRLETHKLFCNCKSSVGADNKSSSITRKQRAVAGELGGIDPAALHEFMRKRTFEYQTFPESSCLVEIDEEPPHELNAEALATVLQVCLMLNARIVDEVHVMRKTVIDGSNTSGFQRTAIVGTSGYLETSAGRVEIPTICVEEESSGIVGEESGKIMYRLDRLGIPLIEIATSPSIVSPEHAKEVAEKIGMLLRATGKVQRGIGTIRQDLNVSVDGGARVELKGVQELALISKYVHNEIERQKKLIEINQELKKRFGEKLEFSGEIRDVSVLFKNTQSKMLKGALDSKGAIFAMKLPNFLGLLGRELYENRRFGTELSDYAKSIAGVRGIMHSDENLEKYGITSEEKEKLKVELKVSPSDAFVVVAAEAERAKKALQVVYERAKFGTVPKETRKALPDGGSAYMRPLPGSARMYPETDIPPVRVTARVLEAFRKNLPESPEQKKKKLEGVLNEELSRKIMASRSLLLFEKIIGRLKVDPSIVAVTLEETLVSLKREGVQIENIKEEKLYSLFECYARGLFVKAAIPEILKFIAKMPAVEVESAIKELNIGKISGKELKKIADEEKKDMKGIMAKYRLRVDAGEVAKLLNK